MRLWLALIALLGVGHAADAQIPGTLPGSFSVSQTGEGTYTIPIFTPEAAGGLAPELALVYGHRKGDGHLGMRWDLAGIRAIERCPRTFAQDGSQLGVWDHSQTDMYCLDGERLVAFQGLYGADQTQYRLERDTGVRVSSMGGVAGAPQLFILDHGDGTRSWFGGDTATFPVSSSDQRPEVWYLARTEDRFGNRIEYSYTTTVTASHREILPHRVEWTRNPVQGLTPRYRVEFTWENRPAPDVRLAFNYGVRRDTTKRLQRVTVSFHGQEIHRYNIAYTTPVGTGTQRSQVQSIQLCRASTCLPATTFEWQNGVAGWGSQSNTGRTSEGHEHVLIGDFNGNGRDDLFVPISVSGTLRWHVIPAQNGTLGAPINTGQAAPSPQHTRIIDYNGDGRADLLVPGTGGTWLIYQSTGSLTPGQQFTVINTQRAVINPAYVSVMDYDADGLPDVVWIEGGEYASTTHWYRNNGGGGQGGLDPAAQISLTGDLYGITVQVDFNTPPDVDRDGRPELLAHGYYLNYLWGEFYEPIFEEMFELYRSTPHGFVSVQQLPNDFLPSSARWVDHRGDGSAGLLYISSGQWRLRPSLSGKFGNPINTGVSSAVGSTAKAFVADYDGDGREDLIIPDGNQLRIYRSTGTGLNSSPINLASTGAGSGTVRTADITGNGVRDILVATGGTWRIHTHNTVLADVITKITDGLGNETTVTHEPISTSAAYSQAGESPSLPNVRLLQKPIHVVTAHSVSDGAGGTASFTHAYVGARWHNRGYGFLGFRSVRTTDTRNGVVQHTRYRQDWPFTGLVDREELHQSASGPLIRRVDHAWTSTSWTIGQQPALHFIKNVETLIEEREVGGPLNGALVRRISLTRSFNDQWRRLTKEVTSHKDAAGTEVLREEREVNTWHAPETVFLGNWCIYMPATTTWKASRPVVGEQIRTEQTSYDTTTCRLTQRDDTTAGVDASLRQRSTFTYNGHGNLETLTQRSVATSGGPAQRQTTFGYDSHQQWPTSETLALAGEPDLTVSRTYDYLLGVELSRTSVDGLTTSWQYDVFGRLTREDRPDGTHTQLAYATCGSCFAQHSRFSITATGSDGSESVSYRDRYGRPVGAQWKVAVDQGVGLRLARREQRYDGFGRVTLESQPYLTGDPVYWIEHDYDLIGRPLVEDRPINESQPAGAQTQIQYRGLEVWVTDAENRVTQYEHNAAGELTKVTDALGGTVQYSYHPFGELHQVTDPESRITTLNIDPRGLKTGMSEPSLGAWSYQYNAFGELTSQTNALAQTTTLTYDQAGRLKTRQEPEGTSTWTYFQSGTGRKGRLEQAQVGDGSQFRETYAYDALGRPTQVTTRLDGTNHLVNASYDSQGRLYELTYPTSTSGYRFVARYAYDSAGALHRLLNGLAPAQILWEREASDALGRAQRVRLGNGLWEERYHDRASGHLAWAVVGTTAGGAQRMDLAYSWDKVGNLQNRSDLQQARTEVFTYDALHRLKTATLNGTQTLSVNYSAAGRITSKSDVGSYTYGNANKPYAVTSAGGVSYGYDANGRMTSRGGAAITWYSYDLPKRINYGSGVTGHWKLTLFGQNY